MGRPREINNTCRQIGGVVEEDDLNIVLESMGRKPISELLREIIKSIADEERKKKQFQQQVSNPYRNSAISLSYENKDIDLNGKACMTPSMVNEYLRQVIEYVSDNEKDIDNLQNILSNGKRLCEQVKIRIRNSYETPTDKRLKELNAAISPQAWEKVRKQEYQQKRQQLEEEYIQVRDQESEETVVEEDEEVIY